MTKRVLVKDYTIGGLHSSVQMYSRMGYMSVSRVVNWSDEVGTVFIQAMAKEVE